MQNKENFYDAYIHLGATWKIATDALVEHAALKQLVKLCENRLEEIRDEAVALAEEDLGKLGRTSGQFTHEDLTFSLDLSNVFLIAELPKKYRSRDAVRYRALSRQKEDAAKAAKTLTKELKGIYDAFPLKHPKVQPDDIKKVLKFIES